jgi:hypothetical protein
LPEIEVETRQNTQTHIEPTTETEKNAGAGLGKIIKTLRM